MVYATALWLDPRDVTHRLPRAIPWKKNDREKKMEGS